MSKMQKWQKLWIEIKTIRANADKRERQFARDLRTEFPTGDEGDLKFLQFIQLDLCENVHLARKLLALAVASRAITNDQVYDQLGVGRKILRLSQMPVRDQQAILAEAQKPGKTVQSVMNDRKHIAQAQIPRTPNVSPMRAAEILDEYWDALESAGIPVTELAQFVAQYAKASKKTRAA